MGSFNDRERGQEKKFELDQEKEFKAQARRAKLIGQWAAAQMGLSDGAAEDYAKSVVMADFEEKGDEDVFRKIRTDLTAANVTLSDHQIRAKMDELLTEARKQIAEG